MLSRLIMDSPFGKLLLEAQNNSLIGCRFLFPQDITVSDSANPLLRKTQKELEEYFSGRRQNFDISLNPCGTPFQQKVWQALQKIPYGRTASYKDIAEAINNTKAYRAVGMANNKNPIVILIPCHRVIGSNGKLVGFAGGLDLKQKLLNLEQNNL